MKQQVQIESAQALCELPDFFSTIMKVLIELVPGHVGIPKELIKTAVQNNYGAFKKHQQFGAVMRQLKRENYISPNRKDSTKYDLTERGIRLARVQAETLANTPGSDADFKALNLVAGQLRELQDRVTEGKSLLRMAVKSMLTHLYKVCVENELNLQAILIEDGIIIPSDLGDQSPGPISQELVSPDPSTGKKLRGGSVLMD